MAIPADNFKEPVIVIPPIPTGGYNDPGVEAPTPIEPIVDPTIFYSNPPDGQYKEPFLQNTYQPNEPPIIPGFLLKPPDEPPIIPGGFSRPPRKPPIIPDVTAESPTEPPIIPDVTDKPDRPKQIKPIPYNGVVSKDITVGPIKFPSSTDVSTEQDRVPLKSFQVEIIKKLLDGTLTWEDLYKGIGSPDLKDAVGLLAKGDPLTLQSTLSVMRVGFGSVKTAKKILNFINHGNIRGYTWNDPVSKQVPPVVGEIIESNEAGVTLSSWEKQGFNEGRTILDKPTFEEFQAREAEVLGLGETQAKLAKKAEDLGTKINEIPKLEFPSREITIEKVNDLVESQRKANPRLILKFSAYYRTTGESVTFQVPFIFSEMEYSGDSKVSPLNVLGRNLQRYHYAGSEDTLELKLIHKTSHDGQSPMEMANKLLNLTKADKYGDIPIVNISFTQSATLVRFFPFGQDTRYILIKAPIKPSRFNPNSQAYIDIGLGVDLAQLERYKNEVYGGGVTPEPMYIEQSLTLKRVAENLTELYPYLS